MLKLNLYKINNTLKSKLPPPKLRNRKDVFIGDFFLGMCLCGTFRCWCFSHVALRTVTVSQGRWYSNIKEGLPRKKDSLSYKERHEDAKDFWGEVEGGAYM